MSSSSNKQSTYHTKQATQQANHGDDSNNRVIRRVYDPTDWNTIVAEGHKVTLKSAYGPAIVLTYTGIISMMGNPESASVVFSNSMGLLTSSFRESESAGARAHLVRVIKLR